MKKLYVIFSISLLISCSQEQSNQTQSTGKQYYPAEDALVLEEEYEAPMTAEPTEPPSFNLEKGSKIIKNGNLSFEVSNLNDSKARVDSLIDNYNAYYENEQFNAYGSRHSYSLFIRVPNQQFDSLILDLENGIGKLEAKNISTEDVTEEYVDLNIRLDNNLAYLNQYKDILKKARSIKEILEVQEKIRRIEEEIDSKKGRLKYIDDKVKYSTLHLQISELINVNVANRPSFGRRISNAFMNGIEAFLSFLVGLVNLWPFLILGLILFLFRKGIFNLFRRRNNQ